MVSVKNTTFEGPSPRPQEDEATAHTPAALPPISVSTRSCKPNNLSQAGEALPVQTGIITSTSVKTVGSQINTLPEKLSLTISKR